MVEQIEYEKVLQRFGLEAEKVGAWWALTFGGFDALSTPWRKGLLQSSCRRLSYSRA